MAATLTVTTTVLADKVLVQAELGPNPDIPNSIFLYENTGTDELGEFFAVCSITDYQRFQAWSGVPISTFGNRYVRYHIGRKYLPLGSTTANVEKAMVDNAKKFRLEYLGLTVPVTRSYNL